MSVLRSRSRLVTFRVSSEEYDALTRSCVTSGARSIADFARVASLDRVQALHAPRGVLSSDLTTLSKSLEDLDTSLRDISDRIRRVLGPGRAEYKTANGNH